MSRRSVTDVQELSRKRTENQHNIVIAAERKATLNEDLSQIESRYLSHLKVEVTRWRDTVIDVNLDRETAAALIDALAQALEATADDPVLTW